MNQATPFVISEFKNPSGEMVFRVSGQLDGKRVRKNFPTRAEAVAERKLLEIARVQAETGIRTAITRLTDEQLQEAEAAFLRLKDCQQSLSVYLDFALANYRAPQRERALCDAVADYVAAKQHEHERGVISAVQVGSIRKELALLMGHFPSSAVAPLTPEKLTTFCERGQPSLKTYNNRRRIFLRVG